MRKMLNI